MGALRKLFRLTPREFWVLAQAAVLLPAVRLALPFTGVGRLTDFRFGPTDDHGSAPMGLRPATVAGDENSDVTLVDSNVRVGSRLSAANSTARMVSIVARRGLCRAKCLEQSLVLRWLLQRQGIDAQIFFGARKKDERMQAHAWVECQGVTLNEAGDVRHKFRAFEAATAAQTE